MALLGTVLSLILAWFTLAAGCGAQACRGPGTDMTAEARHPRRRPRKRSAPFLICCSNWGWTAASTTTVLPIRRAGGAAEMFLGRLLRDVVPPEAAALPCGAASGTTRPGIRQATSSGWSWAGDHWFELSIARKEVPRLATNPVHRAVARHHRAQTGRGALTQLAYFDALTGLPNRRMLLDRMEHALGQRAKSRPGGAVLYRPGQFQTDQRRARAHGGRHAADAGGQRLTQLQRPGDTVARLGGDEFVVLVHNVASDMESAGRAALLVAEEMRTRAGAPCTIDTHLYSTTGSIGIALFPKRGGRGRPAAQADTAMYRAKDLGRNRIHFL